MILHIKGTLKFIYFQAFKTLRSYIERLEKLSEDPDLREEMGKFFAGEI